MGTMPQVRGPGSQKVGKEPDVQKRRKQFFTGVCERLSKYCPNLFVVIELGFYTSFSPHFGYFLAFLHIRNFSF